jgi:hypothetical protein
MNIWKEDGLGAKQKGLGTPRPFWRATRTTSF